MKKVSGNIHSFETFGALDGPGLRFVIFMQGCPLRCGYCHNRDMLDRNGDCKRISVNDLVKTIEDYKPYFGKTGGVTLSGGDPVFQPKFLVEFLKQCKKKGLHTAVDTSLFTSRKVIDEIAPYVDLFMISLKHFDSDIHKTITGVPNTTILNNIKYLADNYHSKIWFRYLVLPGYTDTRKNLRELVEFLHTMDFDRIELLPYHTMGVDKWKKMRLKYQFEGMKPPTPRSIQKIRKMLEKEGFSVLV